MKLKIVDKVQNTNSISVILPVYNGELTLQATFDSLANQSAQDFELLVCNDGSSDASDEIIKRNINKFKNFKLLKNPENIGLARTMNKLVSFTTGDYIAIAEQDDWYAPNRLELQKDVLDKNPGYGLVSGIAEFVDETANPFQFPGLLLSGQQYPHGSEMFLLNYREQLKVVNSCIMFRKKVHVNNGLYFSMHYPNIPIDWAYILRFSLVSDIYGINKVLVKLDRRSNRKSVTKDKETRFSASRELLRSFKFEYPDLITDSDYKYAVRTQKLIENGQLMGSTYVLTMVKDIILFNDERFLNHLKIRLRKKFKK